MVVVVVHSRLTAGAQTFSRVDGVWCLVSVAAAVATFEKLGFFQRVFLRANERCTRYLCINAIICKAQRTLSCH